MVEGFVDGDGRPGIAEAVGTRKDLQDDLVKADSVVLADDTFMLEAEDAVEFCGAEPAPVRTPGGSRV